MKSIFLLLLIFNLVGCDVGSKGNGGSEVAITATAFDDTDTDGDGIHDSDELLNGTSPFIANIPVIQTFDTKEISLKGKYINKENDEVFESSLRFRGRSSTFKNPILENPNFTVVSNSLVRAKSLNATFHKIYMNVANRDSFPRFEDFLYSEVGCVDERELLKKKVLLEKYNDEYEYLKANLNFKYHFLFKNIHGITNISEISSNAVILDKYDNNQYSAINLRSYQDKFNFNQVESLNYKKLFLSKSITKETIGLSELSLSSDCLYHQVEDFTYTSFGKTLMYQDVRSNIEGVNAHILVTTPSESFWVSVAPSEYKSVPDVLNRLNLNPVLDQQLEILSLNGLNSNVSIQDVVLESSLETLDEYRWYFLSTSLKDISDPLEQGGIYILNYATGMEILKNSNNKEKLLEDTLLNTDIDLDRFELKVGDKLIITADLEARLNVTPSSKGSFAGETRVCKQSESHHDGGHKSINSCARWGRGSIRNGCRFTETNNDSTLGTWKLTSADSQRENNLNLWFGGRELELIDLKEGQVGFLIDVLEKDLERGVPELKLKNISSQNYNYTRTRVERHSSTIRQRWCTKGERTFQVTANAKKQFRYKLNVTREGIIR